MSEWQQNLTPTGQVDNPFAFKQADGTNQPIGLGQSGEWLVSRVRGKYAAAAMRGAMFGANLTAVTVPVIGAGLISVFSLYNPPNSGVNLELLDYDMGVTSATMFVNTLGLYFSPPNLASAGTFTTLSQSSITAGIVSGAAGKGQFYSAYTHSGTPTRFQILMTFAAATATNMNPIGLEFDGKIIIPPGVIISAAATTHTAIVDLLIRWIETPA